MQYTIHPYKTRDGRWTFIDPNTNRTEDENELIAGIDDMLNEVQKQFGKKFAVTFSDTPVANPFLTLRRLHGDKRNESKTGNTYVNVESGEEGWLCSVLFDYFDEAPDMLYLTISKG